MTLVLGELVEHQLGVGIGGSLGGVVGLLGQQFMPDVITQPGAFVVVGMAGFFAAAAKTPISTLVMVSEMTGNYQLLLPSLWVCSLSYLLGRKWKLYRSQVATRLDSPAHSGAMFVDVLSGVRVESLISGSPRNRLRTIFLYGRQFAAVVNRDQRRNHG